MDKRSFRQLLQGVREAGAILRGQAKPARVFRYREPTVKALRQGSGVSQSEFARLIGVPVKTLQNWEQGRTRPTGPARALLKIVAGDPKAAIRALHA